MKDLAPDASRSSQPTRLKKALFVVLIWMVLLIAAEIACRTYLYSTGRGFFDSPDKFTSPFFTTYDEPPPFKSGTTASYRNGKIQFAKAPNEIRVICFGGSTTVNWRAGVSYPELVERRLSERYPHYVIRVLNAGGEGYSTAHILVNLSLRNLELKPDIISIYENINDLSAKDFGDQIASDYANKYKSDFFLDFRHRTGLIAELTKISRLARSVFSRINMIAFPDVGYGGGRHSLTQDYRPWLPYFVLNLRSIVALAKEHGIRVLLASQPARANFRYEGFAAYNETMRALARERSLAFVDVAAVVSDDDLFLPDSVHNTRKGVERVAEVFYSPLEQLVKEVINEREQGKRD